MIASAVISDDHQYRYILEREWGAEDLTLENGDHRVLWIMLNPSTADALKDDPTLTRCIGYSRAWGYGALSVVNLYALRTPDPTLLNAHPDPIGPAADAWIRAALRPRNGRAPGCAVVGWGATKPKGINHAARVAAVTQMIFDAGVSMVCLGRNKDGSPGHPLYLKKDAETEEWP